MKCLISWSSESLPDAMRLRGWRDALHDNMLEMDAVPLRRQGFFSSLKRCALLTVLPQQVCGAPQKVARCAADIARGRRNAYYLISQPRLHWRVVHAGAEQLVQPGDAVLIDSREPYQFDFGAGLEGLSIEMPIDWVEHWVPTPSRLIGQPLRGDAGWGLALRGIHEALTASAGNGGAQDNGCDALIEAQLGGILALVGDAAGPSRASAAHARALSVMRARFMEPGLSAGEVAAEAGLSLRSLHRAMATQGQGFLSTLMALRVEAAAGLLTQARWRHLTVAEIGRRCGFSDASHFARQFSQQRCMTPTAFRAQALR